MAVEDVSGRMHVCVCTSRVTDIALGVGQIAPAAAVLVDVVDIFISLICLLCTTLPKHIIATTGVTRDPRRNQVLCDMRYPLHCCTEFHPLP